jgi:hypothetical protein
MEAGNSDDLLGITFLLRQPAQLLDARLNSKCLFGAPWFMKPCWVSPLDLHDASETQQGGNYSPIPLSDRRDYVAYGK